jgi:hypothetical protein
MARTAVIAGTATATVAGTKAVIGAATGPSKAEVAAQQQAATAAAAEQQAATAEQQAAAAAAASSGLSSEQMAQLRELAALKNDGIITEAEFEVQKAKLLA